MAVAGFGFGFWAPRAKQKTKEISDKVSGKKEHSSGADFETPKCGHYSNSKPLPLSPSLIAVFPYIYISPFAFRIYKKSPLLFNRALAFWVSLGRIPHLGVCFGFDIAHFLHNSLRIE